MNPNKINWVEVQRDGGCGVQMYACYVFSMCQQKVREDIYSGVEQHQKYATQHCRLLQADNNKNLRGH